MASNALHMTMDVLNVPELIWDTRRAMADMLREEADADANPAVARKLREIAAVFEVGQETT